MFDFVKRVLLQRPSTANVREVYNHINASLGSITTRVNLTADRNAFRAAVSEVNNLNKGLKQSKNLADDFAGIVANATRRFAGISIATGTMLSLARGVKNAYKESLEFERQMKRVEIATGATQSEINKLSSSVLALGSAYGVSSTELASNARIFAQAGLSTRTTAKALEILAKTTVAGTFGDIGDTAEGVVASLQQFREEVIKTGGEVQFLERTFDSIQNVSKKYAVEAEDIVIGIRKAGAAFESAGGTIDELIGTMTTLRSTTRESASTLANSMKTIFTRIQRPETIDFLRNIGVELVDMEGKFVGPVEAINRLGAALAVLDKGDVRYAQIADKIGGIYQINRLLTLLKNTSMTSQAIDTSRDSSGVLSEDAQKGLETTISKIERLNQKFFDLIKTLGDTSTIRGVVDLLIRIADSAITVTKSLEPLMPMIAAMLGIAGGRFAFGVGRRLVGIASNPTSMAQTQVGGVATGGYIGGRGGRIRGGAQGIDTVPAMLDNGEFVINRKDAAKNIGLLTAINNGKNVQKFADGGPVMTGFYMNQYKTTKALSGSLNAEQYTKLEGESFTRGKDGKLFNYEDEIKLKIDKISVGNEFAKKLNQYPATPDFVKNLKNYTQTSNDSLRGKAFEELYATVNGINLADNNTSRIDGIKGSSLYEFKSKTRNEPIENIIDKFFGAATEPRSNIDQAVFEALKSKKLTPYPETIDFGKNFKSLTLVEDSILGKGVLDRDPTSSSIMSAKSTIPQLRKALADRGEIIPAGTSDSSMREMLKARGVEFKAKGGRIGGGKPGVDTVPAMLDNGEFVVNRKDSAKNIGLLTAINSGRDVQKLADGTAITNSSASSNNNNDEIKKLTQSLNDLRKELSSYSDVDKKIKTVEEKIVEARRWVGGERKSRFLEPANSGEELISRYEEVKPGSLTDEDKKRFRSMTPDQAKNFSLRENAGYGAMYSHEGGILNGIKTGRASRVDTQTNEELELDIQKSNPGLNDLRSLIQQRDELQKKKIRPQTDTSEIDKLKQKIKETEAQLDKLLQKDSQATSTLSSTKASKTPTPKSSGKISIPESFSNIPFKGDLTGYNPNYIKEPKQEPVQTKTISEMIEKDMKKTGQSFSQSFDRVMLSFQRQLEKDLEISKNSTNAKDRYKASQRIERVLPSVLQTSKEGVARERVSKAVQESFLPKDQGLSKEYQSSVVKRTRELKLAEESGDVNKVARLEAVGARYNISGSHGTLSQSTMQEFNLNPKESVTTSSSSTKNNQKLGRLRIPKSSINTMSSGGGGPCDCCCDSSNARGQRGPNIPGSPNNQNNPAQQLNKPTGDFTQKLLLAAGALSFLADSSGLTSGSFNKASVAAAATYTTIQVMGSAFSSLSEALSNFKIPQNLGGGDGGGDIDISGGGGGGGGKSSRSGKSGGRFGKLRSLGGKIGGRLGGVGRLAAGAAGAAGGALTGVGIGLAGAQFISSYYGSEAEKKEQEKNEELKRIEEKGGGKAKLAELQAKSRAAALNKGKSENAMTAGVSGAISGAGIGAVIGSVVPVLGTSVGAGVGGAIGGIGGAIAGSLSTTEKSLGALITTSDRLALAQMTAAQGAYDFETSVSNIKNSGLKGKDLVNALSGVREKAQADQKAIQSEQGAATLEILNEKNWSNFFGSFGLGDYTLSDVGIGSERGVASEAGKEKIKQLNEANEKAQQTIAKASQEEISAKKDFIMGSIGSAKSLQELEKISNNLGPELSSIGQLAYDATIGTEEEKRKAQKAAIDGAKVMEKKLIEAKGAEIVKTQAAIAARNLEIESIQRTSAALTSFNKQSLDISKSNQALQQFQTGSSDIISGQVLSDMTNIADRKEFNNTARAVGSTFAGGDEAARNVIIGSDFINKFQSGITGAMGKNFETISGGSLDASKTEQSIQNELYNNIDSFRNMGTAQQKAIVSAIQTEMGDDFSASSLKGALDKITNIFKDDANKLTEQSKLINENVNALKAWNSALIESQMKTAELRAGQVDILGTGSNRMSQVMSRYGNVGTEMRALDSQEGFRTARANTLLEGSGVAPIAGNVQALSSTLQNLQGRKLAIDEKLKTTVDPVQRNNLTSENQKLAAATATVTNELTRLANQSDRASDIMAKIEKQRQIRDYQSNRAKDFITGGRDTRMKMFEETAAMQNVMQTGSFQNIPDELKGAVRQMMEERAKLDPTGGMQQALDRALNNDAAAINKMFPGLIPPGLLDNKPDTAEEKWINDLKALNAQEFQAQQQLITAQERNTQATLQLINQIANQMGQQVNPAIIQQPQQQGKFPQSPMQPNMAQTLNGVNNAFNQMQMNHQLNVNGQINLPGLNMDGIAQQLTQHIGAYVAQEVARQMNQRNRGFNAGG